MLIRRAIGPGAMIAVLAVSGLAGAAAAQDEFEPVDPVEEPAVEKTTTGTVVLQEEDGRTVYYLEPRDGSLIQLSYGPSWFWGALDPLDGLEGKEVTIGGRLRDGMPNENASDTGKEHAAKAAAMRVRSIDGEKRKGKPAWAGGPKVKVVDESHPGYKGAAAKAAKPAKPEKAAKPEKPAKP